MGERVQTCVGLAMLIAALTRNYKMARKKGNKENRLEKPSEGNITMNIDAAFDIDSGTRAT
jgi:hypothetical protein